MVGWLVGGCVCGVCLISKSPTDDIRRKMMQPKHRNKWKWKLSEIRMKTGRAGRSRRSRHTELVGRWAKGYRNDSQPIDFSLQYIVYNTHINICAFTLHRAQPSTTSCKIFCSAPLTFRGNFLLFVVRAVRVHVCIYYTYGNGSSCQCRIERALQLYCIRESTCVLFNFIIKSIFGRSKQ